jgi:hypothetical protein
VVDAAQHPVEPTICGIAFGTRGPTSMVYGRRYQRLGEGDAVFDT